MFTIRKYNTFFLFRQYIFNCLKPTKPFARYKAMNTTAQTISPTPSSPAAPTPKPCKTCSAPPPGMEKTPLALANADPSDVLPGGKTYYIFLVSYLVLLSAFGSFVNDMYLPSLPEMKRFFATSVSEVQLGLTTGMIGLAVGQLLLGPLSDRFGRKPVLIISMLVFIGGAVASVYSPNIQTFLGWRFVQGLGASGAYFLARTVPADIYGGRELAKIMALVGAINGFAPASAPVLGGFLAGTIHWQGIFWVLAGFAVLLIVICFFFKESLPSDKRAKGPLLQVFKEYLPLFKNKQFMTHVMLKGVALGLLFAYTSSAPFIIQDVYHFSQLDFGLFMGFNALFAAAGSVIALKFKVLKDAAWVGGWVLMITAVVEALCLFFVHDFWAYEVGMLPLIFSLGMIFTVGNTLAMNEGRSNAGAASAILGIGGYFFGGIVAPLVGIGDILHSTAIVFLVMAFLTLICSYGTRRLAPDLL